MSPTLRLKESHLPITAIGHAANCILTGEGSDLCVYDHESKLLLGRYAVFAGQQIHGIVTCDAGSLHRQWLLIWGGDSLCLARIIGAVDNEAGNDQSAKVSIDFVSFEQAEDWILDVSFCPYNTHQGTQVWTAMLVTAHNAVYAIEYDSVSSSSASKLERNEKSPSLALVQLSPRSRSISYTGRISWTGPTDALVLLGTAFGEVFVLACSLKPTQYKTSVRAAFLAHEGSVFGLSLSEPVQLDREEPSIRLLVTCSDDRTVRVWNLEKMLADGQEELGASYNDSATRTGETTGFAEYRSVDDAQVTVNASSLASAMGHVSRVWHLHTLVLSESKQKDISVQITSVGEDATCQVWEFKRQDDASYRLTSVASDKHHGGRNIWSSAQVVRSGVCEIVTGGADGGLISRKISTRAEIEEKQRSLTWSEAELAQAPNMCFEATQLQAAPANDSVRSYAFFSPDAALACTNSGRVLMLHPDDGKRRDHWTWHVIGQEQNLRGFSVAAGLNKGASDRSHMRQYVLIGGAQGHLYIASRLTGQVKLLHKAESKIASIHTPSFNGDLPSTVSPDRRSSPSQFTRIVVLTYVQNKIPDVFVFEDSDSETQGGSTTVLRPLKIGGSVNDSNFSLSSTTITSVAIARDTRYLHAIFGTRDGSVFSVRLMADNAASSHHSELHKGALISDAHGRDAVTDLVLHDDPLEKSGIQGLSSHLYSVGRDGTLTVHRIRFGDKENESQKVHKLALPFGPNIEGIHLGTGRSAGLFVSGFAGSRFVLFDVTRQREVLSTDCGGSHRTWSFCPCAVTRSDRFTEIMGGVILWTQAGMTRLHVCDYRTEDGISRESRSHTIKQGHHGREIKATDVVIRQLEGTSLHGDLSEASGGSVAGLSALSSTLLKTVRSFFAAQKTQHSLIATGAEDTDIRIHTMRKPELSTSSASMECVAVLKKHQTGINCLRWSNKGEYLFSSGGCEEFFVWRITPTPLLRYGVYCESVCPDLTADADLRITSFSVYETPELTHLEDGEPWFLIAMAFSNSMIRIYRYSPTLDGKNRWSLPITSSYTSCCIMQTEYLVFNDESLMLLTAGSDGQLAIWDLSTINPATGRVPTDTAHKSANLKPFKVLKLHQSAIKTLTTIPLDDQHTLVITGGDDNAINIVLLRLGTEVSDDIIAQVQADVVRVPGAHAAAVTSCVAALKLSNGTAETPNSFIENILASLSTARRFDAPTIGNRYQVEAITSSNDQKMKGWQVDIDTARAGAEAIVAVKRTDKQCTGVADVSGLNWLSTASGATRDLLVTGVGMEIWRQTH